MLKYSEEAKKVLPLFYSRYNDVEIFVEDENDEVFYTELITKITDNKLKISRIFGLGGKEKLLQNLQNKIDSSSLSKQFYIVDGDFDIILNREFPNTDRLHVLNAYCVENFLLEEDAICSVVQEDIPNKTFEQWKSKLEFPIWLKESVELLSPLFAFFLLIQKLNLNIKNVGTDVSIFIDNNLTFLLDEEKIALWIKNKYSEQNNLNPENLDEMLKSSMLDLGTDWGARKNNICAKKYLLPLLRLYITKREGKLLNYDSFRFRLAKNCSFNSLEPLRNQIFRVFKSVKS
ncbi:DUF4435 domain-containing protein [Dehalococcoides mccartyi]|uniref:DUF4435 domain-containing protein n=1 Tax=Dehalococcoides mccartyi TaxID=61435 RepID=UPI0003C88010|nr:DUF4435 domain-containing protein [Dehalococcoides mccartyi]AHB12902.1 hypothetical protein GY50_0116 [Dehalococcoides mccartyi GY50]